MNLWSLHSEGKELAEFREERHRSRAGPGEELRLAPDSWSLSLPHEERRTSQQVQAQNKSKLVLLRTANNSGLELSPGARSCDGSVRGRGAAGEGDPLTAPTHTGFTGRLHLPAHTTQGSVSWAQLKLGSMSWTTTERRTLRNAA